MLRPLLIPHPHNATIEELKQLSRVASIEIATSAALSRCCWPVSAEWTFWTDKAFHGCIGKRYQIECSYETVVRFFHKQGFALKTPQPWPDKQDAQLREAFLQELEKLFNRTDVDI